MCLCACACVCVRVCACVCLRVPMRDSEYIFLYSPTSTLSLPPSFILSVLECLDLFVISLSLFVSRMLAPFLILNFLLCLTVFVDLQDDPVVKASDSTAMLLFGKCILGMILIGRSTGWDSAHE